MSLNFRSKKAAPAVTFVAQADETTIEPPKNLVADLADAFGLSSYNLVSFTLAVDGESIVVNGEYKVTVDGAVKTRVKKIGLHR